MSYDIFLFDPSEAPRGRAAFLDWFGEVTQWSEGHSYNDSSVTTPALKAWYDEMRQEWPAMNGPDSPLADEPDDSPLYESDRITDYSIGKTAIYCCFRWSAAQKAREAIVKTTKAHKVGFFLCSETDGMIVFPDYAL